MIRTLLILLALPFILLSQNNSSEYKYLDNRIKSIQIKNIQSIEELYSKIIKNNYTDEEKVYVIGKFIVENIKYGKRARKPINCVNTKEGVCQDYSELFKALCDIAQIECHIVTGNGKNSSTDIGFYNSNHAWNIIKINGEYKIYDLTWAAGYVSQDVFEKRFNPFYFNSSPERFILNHFPDDSKWQLLDNPMSIKEFISLPYFDSDFLNSDITNFSLKEGVVKSDKLKITFESKENFTSASLFRWDLHSYGQASGKKLKLTKNRNKYTIEVNEEINGAFRCSITLWKEDNESVSVDFKQVTSNFRIPKPKEWDLEDPYSLISPYYYAFHQLDTDLFRRLNKRNSIPKINNITNAKALNKSLKDWYGDYRNYYVNDRDGNIYFPVNNFKIVLRRSADGYVFKEIKKDILKKGSIGFRVKEVEKFFGIKQDGYFDEELVNLVKSFQKKNNLKPDGIIGDNTLKYMGK